MAEPGIIDATTFTRLLESVQGDADFLSELVDAYLGSTPEIVATMRQAVADGDAGKLQRAAHSLKSGSNDFGALAFAGLCKELEEQGKTGVLDGAGEKIAAIEAAYPAVAAGLQAGVQRARLAAA